MSARRFAFWIALCAAPICTTSCSFDETANEAHGCDEQCAVCSAGFCLMTIEEAATASGGSGGSAGAGASGGSGGAGAGGGSGGAGAGGSGGAGAGGGTPAGAGGGGQCVPAIEVCNALDDDCDGAIDEDTEGACYPAGTAGCVAGADGSFECTGMCAAGTQRCEGGVLSECSGFVAPAQEACGSAEAADENCDGSIDDGCPCQGAETQPCYGGPRFTAGVGPCRAGMQQCQGGVFGACVGEVTPVPETCANQGRDDDCDRQRDDVPNRGNICFDFSKLGACFTGIQVCQGSALVCDTPDAAATETACDFIDEDCDGDVDETFAFASDEQNCGGCGTRCAAGEQCCGGTCRAVGSDEAHCGMCNNPCGAGLTCCAGACAATDTRERCGGCNIACGPNQECCDSACVDTNTTARCGGCNTACGPGQGCCNESCVDLTTSAHCGSCEIACGEVQNCCGGSCVTPGDDDMHCGACGVVCPAECPCSAGECRDSSGLACL